MFNTETLFIFGAGASAPYGYPIGKNLIKDIIGDMEDKILIPKYSSGSTSPCWNKNDRTHNILYEFDMLLADFNQVIPNEDQIKQNHVRKNSDDGEYIVFLNQNDNSHNINKRFFCAEIKNINIFNRLKIALEVFDPVSIDAFLRDNPTYATAGKIMISYSLLKREDGNKFNLSKCSDNWYSLLLNDLVSECADKPEKLKENKVKFITFNYDVSLVISPRIAVHLV